MLIDIMSGDDARFSAICRRQGWKRTSQRRAVFSYLCGNSTHPTVDNVWRNVRESLPDVSLDSVYRILDDFTAAGLVRRLEGGKAVRYDADTGDHEHYLCTRCGVIYDFKFLKGRDRLREVCRDIGRVDSVSLFAYGVCRACENADAPQLLQ